jgi:tetratricopeptide (TPR) repeat protein
MTLKQYLNQGHMALVLFVALIMGGYASASRAAPDDTRDLPPEQAREQLTKAILTDYLCPNPTALRVTYKKIERTCASSAISRKEAFRITAKPELVIKRDHDLWIPMAWICPDTHVGKDDLAGCLFLWKGSSAEITARNFLRAWKVVVGAVDPAEEAIFENAAQIYRNATVKPQLPEEAVKYKVQAELAVQQKRFDDAVDLYDQALGIAPWWPAGHYNRGLILGELEDYQGGMRALHKYLKLEPDAPIARAVQLKIYQWESLVPRAAK